jgi:hypothetical protein
MLTTSQVAERAPSEPLAYSVSGRARLLKVRLREGECDLEVWVFWEKNHG